MSAATKLSDEAYWRLKNFRTEVVRNPSGYNVHFFCCGRDVKLGPLTDAETLGQTVLDHIERPCPEQAAPPLKSLRPINFKGQAIAKSNADRVTPRQLVNIRAICTSHGLIAQEICSAHFKCKLEDLRVSAASALIDWLKAEASGRRANICRACGLDRDTYGHDADCPPSGQLNDFGRSIHERFIAPKE